MVAGERLLVVSSFKSKRLWSQITLYHALAVKYLGGKCGKCGRTGNNLHIHHIDGNWRNNQKENLMLFCASCHKKDQLKDIDVSSVTVKGYRHRTTVPNKIFRYLDLKDKDKLRWILLKRGTIIVEKVTCSHP